MLEVTSTPIRIFFVRAARPASSVQASKYGPSGRLGWIRWSQSQALWKPISSNCCQRWTVFSQVMFWSVQMPNWNLRATPFSLSARG